MGIHEWIWFNAIPCKITITTFYYSILNLTTFIDRSKLLSNSVFNELNILFVKYKSIVVSTWTLAIMFIIIVLIWILPLIEKFLDNSYTIMMSNYSTKRNRYFCCLMPGLRVILSIFSGCIITLIPNSALNYISKVLVQMDIFFRSIMGPFDPSVNARRVIIFIVEMENATCWIPKVSRNSGSSYYSLSVFSKTPHVEFWFSFFDKF